MDMTITFPGGARVDARSAGFVIHTDQPVDHGGGGSAPAPFELFIASLGTCAGFYVLGFLTRRGIATEDVRLTLHTTRDPDRDLLSEITIRVHLPASFPRKYAQAVASAVNLCAVKRHLLDPPRLSTEVQIGEPVASPAVAIR
jgi:ribosomal protein S12 methylthiotransferase accessory factor